MHSEDSALWILAVSEMDCHPFLELNQVHSVSLVKQERAQHWAHLAVAPMFAENISRVDVASNVVKRNHFGSYCFPRVVVREGMIGALTASSGESSCS